MTDGDHNNLKKKKRLYCFHEVPNGLANAGDTDQVKMAWLAQSKDQLDGRVYQGPKAKSAMCVCFSATASPTKKIQLKKWIVSLGSGLWLRSL